MPSAKLLNDKLPKAELHVHLEGTLQPALAIKLAKRNDMPLPKRLFNAMGDYNWQNFTEFLKSYDTASSVIRTHQDYVDVTYDYLASIAKDGAIYCEITIGPDIPAMFGMDYPSHLAAVSEGADKALAEFGIECRFIICLIRHMGPQVALEMVKNIKDFPNNRVVGVGMAGNELMHGAHEFAPAFEYAKELGLGCTAHAGEVDGPKSVWDTIDSLPVTRIGHGVRSIEDPALVAELKKREITLEICPHSNVALGVYPNLAAHPLRQLYEAGIVGSLNSDDPPFFWTDLASEYAVAISEFGFSEDELLGLTRRAIEVSFAEPALKKKLLKTLESSKAA